jgi:hypothetical protein
MKKNKIKNRNKPVIIIDEENGNKYCYIDDEIYDEHTLIIEFRNGDKEWYFNKQLHRLDGPAIEKANGDKIWYVNGKLHREDGPAIESNNKTYYLDGKKVTEDEVMTKHNALTEHKLLNDSQNSLSPIKNHESKKIKL